MGSKNVCGVGSENVCGSGNGNEKYVNDDVGYGSVVCWSVNGI